MPGIKKPDTPHSRYSNKVCRSCGGKINRIFNRSGLCSECYVKTFNTERFCLKCNTIKPANEFTPTSVYCKKCLSKYTNDKWKKLKKDAVEYKGGRCEICGYNKCIAALEFHHKNSSEKEFNIGSVRTLQISLIADELDKCILLCANCHREAHNVIS
ncbi:MAG TPA: hypothetical protein DEG71_07320 [Clostridiales bacterium]|nr:hypothetical protein [Clostridiales bacterium]